MTKSKTLTLAIFLLTCLSHTFHHAAAQSSSSQCSIGSIDNDTNSDNKTIPLPQVIAYNVEVTRSLSNVCWAIVNETITFASASAVCDKVGLRVATLSFQDVNIRSMEMINVTKLSLNSSVERLNDSSSCDGDHTCFDVTLNSSTSSSQSSRPLTLSMVYNLSEAFMRAENFEDGPFVPRSFNLVRFRLANAFDVQLANITVRLSNVSNETLLVRRGGAFGGGSDADENSGDYREPLHRATRNNVSVLGTNVSAGFEVYVIDVNSSQLCAHELEYFNRETPFLVVFIIVLVSLATVGVFALCMRGSCGGMTASEDTLLTTTAATAAPGGTAVPPSDVAAVSHHHHHHPHAHHHRIMMDDREIEGTGRRQEFDGSRMQDLGGQRGSGGGGHANNEAGQPLIMAADTRVI